MTVLKRILGLTELIFVLIVVANSQVVKVTGSAVTHTQTQTQSNECSQQNALFGSVFNICSNSEIQMCLIMKRNLQVARTK
jgi:hypothetical protein